MVVPVVLLRRLQFRVHLSLIRAVAVVVLLLVAQAELLGQMQEMAAMETQVELLELRTEAVAAAVVGETTVPTQAAATAAPASSSSNTQTQDQSAIPAAA
jgi:hypothetical protein